MRRFFSTIRFALLLLLLLQSAESGEEKLTYWNLWLKNPDVELLSKSFYDYVGLPPFKSEHPPNPWETKDIEILNKKKERHVILFINPFVADSRFEEFAEINEGSIPDYICYRQPPLPSPYWYKVDFSSQEYQNKLFSVLKRYLNIGFDSICVEGFTHLLQWGEVDEGVELLRKISELLSGRKGKLFIELTRDDAFYLPDFVDEVSSTVDGVIFVNFFTDREGNVRNIFEEDLHKLYVWDELLKFSIETTDGDANKAAQAFKWGRRTGVVVTFVDPERPDALVVFLPKYRELKVLTPREKSSSSSS